MKEEEELAKVLAKFAAKIDEKADKCKGKLILAGEIPQGLTKEDDEEDVEVELINLQTVKVASKEGDFEDGKDFFECQVDSNSDTDFDDDLEKPNIEVVGEIGQKTGHVLPRCDTNDRMVSKIGTGVRAEMTRHDSQLHDKQMTGMIKT